VISEGSCDTEDWSNDAENTAFITGINWKKAILNYYDFTALLIKARLILTTIKMMAIYDVVFLQHGIYIR